ncbi:MAG: adenylosuccinate synthetase [Clostridiales bacterium]|nr:adenylosuccinate synthetase [Clostridiales bacterium]
MRRAKIIIGCNYGDEGKGLATAYCAGSSGGACLNVLINGGAQRGHTVETPNGKRHVFHHFGSATFHGAVSCADEDFILNPLLYCQERMELQQKYGLEPQLMISARCRVSTPYDMILGQIIEENRGSARHGSCGCGIQETRVRYQQTDWSLPWGEMVQLTDEAFAAYCRRIAEDALPQRLERLGMPLPDAWRPLLEDRGIVEHAWLDFQEMKQHTRTYEDWSTMAASYSLLLFEAGQGLALDENNLRDFPHLTPSSTTSLVSARRIAALPGVTETEVIYVTRSYFTRHGAGPFPTECPKETINPRMEDRTNVPNPHQHSLRYGLFDEQALSERVQADETASRQVLPKLRTALLVTHLNETGGQLTGDGDIRTLAATFDRVLCSAAPWQVAPWKETVAQIGA